MKTKNAQHTKGPWVVAGRTTSDDCLEIKTVNPTENKRKFIAAVYPKPCYEDTQDADARLITASPDLLSACREALDYLGRIDEGSEGCELRDSLRAAIAKAEGR